MLLCHTFCIYNLGILYKSLFLDNRNVWFISTYWWGLMKLAHQRKWANSLIVSQHLPKVQKNGAFTFNTESPHFCFSLEMLPEVQCHWKDLLRPLDGRQYFSAYFNRSVFLMPPLWPFFVLQYHWQILRGPLGSTHDSGSASCPHPMLFYLSK